MKNLKVGFISLAVAGLLCVLPAAVFSQASAGTPSDSVLVVAKGGSGSSSSGSGGSSSSSSGSVSGPGTASGTDTSAVSDAAQSQNQGSGSNSGTAPASGKQSDTQSQTQTTERLETRQNAPDNVNGQKENRIMESARGSLKQIQEQTTDQARAGKWQELLGQLDQVKEQCKLQQLTREEAKTLLQDCLKLAQDQQNLAEQENILKDIVEVDPTDKNACKELGATYRLSEKNGIKVFANGMELKFDVPPVIKDGRTLIPVRAITEGLGATVNYDAEKQTVTVTRGETTIVLTLGQNTALVNGLEVSLDTSAELNDNRTVVPLRFIAETFKLNVDYYPDGELVTVNNSTTGTATDNTANTTGSTTESATQNTVTKVQ